MSTNSLLDEMDIRNFTVFFYMMDIFSSFKEFWILLRQAIELLMDWLSPFEACVEAFLGSI